LLRRGYKGGGGGEGVTFKTLAGSEEKPSPNDDHLISPKGTTVTRVSFLTEKRSRSQKING